MKLNLGCHWRKLEGFVNVDIDPATKPDVMWDLNKVPWKPFKSGSAEFIYANHIIEHLGFLDTVFKEMARVLKMGGEVFIAVPYVTNAYSLSLLNYSRWHNHKHVGFIHDSFDALAQANGLRIYKREIMFARPYRYLGLQWLFNKLPNIYNHFFLFTFPAYELRVWMRKAELGKSGEYHH